MIELKPTVLDENKKEEVVLEVLKLPTRMMEITSEYLKQCVSHIKLEPYYAIVALTVTTRLNDLCYTVVGNKDRKSTVGITPRLAAINPGDNKCNGVVGDITIINDTNLSRGEHIYINSDISYNKVQEFLVKHEQYRKEIITGKHDELKNAFVKLLQFKIVPVCDIHGYYNYEEHKKPHVFNIEANPENALYKHVD